MYLSSNNVHYTVDDCLPAGGNEHMSNLCGSVDDICVGIKCCDTQ